MSQLLCLACFASLFLPGNYATAAKAPKEPAREERPPDLLMDGGRIKYSGDLESLRQKWDRPQLELVMGSELDTRLVADGLKALGAEVQVEDLAVRCVLERDQSIGAEQIKQAMLSINSNVSETASSLAEFNRATTHLRGSVDLLNQEISQFRI